MPIIFCDACDHRTDAPGNAPSQDSGFWPGKTAAARIGVLAYNGKGAEAVQDDWSHVRNWLEASIPHHRFILLDFDQAGLTRAVQTRAVDFAITNSGHCVTLENSDGANRIATIESPWEKFGHVKLRFLD